MLGVSNKKKVIYISSIQGVQNIKCLRIQNGEEYTNGEFLAFYKQEGIQR